MLYVTNLSTLKTCYLCRCLQHVTAAVTHPPTSLPHLPVPQQPNLLLGHFRDKSSFLPFLPAKDNANVTAMFAKNALNII